MGGWGEVVPVKNVFRSFAFFFSKHQGMFCRFVFSRASRQRVRERAGGRKSAKVSIYSRDRAEVLAMLAAEQSRLARLFIHHHHRECPPIPNREASPSFLLPFLPHCRKESV